ncbi:hypothetical protein CDL12_22169 [Handroanthus impetiginosus]|uniref:Maternal effect embryo arrest 60 n=1 Tax=Handroanthus impetiginosus TaxID=429701 RepID=A0A2G9GJS5_9LAMI|nr:hypothetical protein CDL12_22169 [Handroanthus impetiginosus]
MSQNSVSRHKLISATSIHIMALDGSLSVNSLFTFASFIGIALNPADPNNSLVTGTACAASSAAGKHFLEFHVYSFSSFLFSSLIASCLKLAIKSDDKKGWIHGSREMHSGGRVNLRLLRAGILASAAGSLFGCAFLTAALVELVQIKLGTLACWGWYTLAAVTPLVVLVPFALLIYICLLIYAFTR